MPAAAAASATAAEPATPVISAASLRLAAPAISAASWRLAALAVFERPAETMMLSAALAKAVALTPATSATPAPTAAPVPTATRAASTLSVAPVQPEVLVAFVPPAEMTMLAMAAVASQELMGRLASPMTAAPEFPAGHSLPLGPALCRLAGGPCNR